MTHPTRSGQLHTGVEPGQEILRVDGLHKHYQSRRGLRRRGAPAVKAINGVSLRLHAGQTLGLVGETGCGKSTTARTVMGLLEPTEGHVYFRGKDIVTMSGSELDDLRLGMQMVFQDPYSSLDPRMPVQQLIAEPLHINHVGTRAERAERVRELIELVGLNPEHAGRYPHEFSGGQRQRISIARALALRPQVLILDEPVSALDVSLQAQIISLLTSLQETLGMAYIFISHDLSVVRYICSEVAVMYLGKIVEQGPVADVFERPTHPYSQALLSSVPIPDPDLRGQREQIVLSGDIPSPSHLPRGCSFSSRCFAATEICREQVPELEPHLGPDHLSACHHAQVHRARPPADPAGGPGGTPGHGSTDR